MTWMRRGVFGLFGGKNGCRYSEGLVLVFGVAHVLFTALIEIKR